MGSTLEHDNTPDQIGVCGAITNLATADFEVDNGQHFIIDNENEEAVVLEVKFARMDTFVSKKIYPGPNLFLLKAIKQNEVLTAPELANLKYGY